MPKTVSSLTNLARPLVAQFNTFCQENDLMGAVETDLICIRCSDSEIYEARRRDAESRSVYIYQSMVSGRRVSLIKLTDTIPTIAGTIEYLELCDQKPDNSQDDRISHVTIVPVTLSYEEIVEKLRGNGVEVNETVRPHYRSADIKLPSGFTIRIASEFLVDTIKREEFI